jgi:hypothetical protein
LVIERTRKAAELKIVADCVLQCLMMPRLSEKMILVAVNTELPFKTM